MLTRLPSRRRCFVTAVVLSASAIVLVLADPAWARAVGLDVWNYPDLQQEFREAATQSEELDAADEHMLRRIEVKEALIRDLIAGRTTLAEVTAVFHEMTHSQPKSMVVIRYTFAGDTDQEKVARSVIGYAVLRASPAERDALEHRLEAELKRMLAGSASP